MSVHQKTLTAEKLQTLCPLMFCAKQYLYTAAVAIYRTKLSLFNAALVEVGKRWLTDKLSIKVLN